MSQRPFPTIYQRPSYTEQQVFMVPQCDNTKLKMVRVSLQVKTVQRKFRVLNSGTEIGSIRLDARSGFLASVVFGHGRVPLISSIVRLPEIPVEGINNDEVPIPASGQFVDGPIEVVELTENLEQWIGDKEIMFGVVPVFRGGNPITVKGSPVVVHSDSWWSVSTTIEYL